MAVSPSSHLPPSSIHWLYISTFKLYLLLLFLHETSSSFLLSISIKILDRYAEKNMALYVNSDTTVQIRVCANIMKECTDFLCARVWQQCLCITLPFSGAPLSHVFHICRALFVPNLCYRNCYHGYSQRGPLTQWQTQWPWQPQDQWWVIW